MTRIKCNYMYNPYDVSRGGKPIYCNHRNRKGFCSLKEIEIDECDGGWQATCEDMKVKEAKP